MLPRPAPRRRLSAGLATLGLTVALAVAAGPFPALAQGSDAQRSGETAKPPVGHRTGATAAALAQRIKQALAASSYPAHLTPTLGDYEGGQAETMKPEAQCLNPDDIFGVDQCNYGPADAPKLAVVLGDSVSASFIPGLINALVPEGYRIHGLALGGCPVADVRAKFDLSPALKKATERCNRSHHSLYAQVQRMDPDLLIMTDSASGLQRLESGNRGEAAVQEWIGGERSALSRLGAPGRKLVILAPNPVGANPGECPLGPTADPHACVVPVQTWWYGKRRAESTVAKEYGATYVDTLGWFSSGGQTPVFEGGLTMRWDGSHITAAYSRMLGPLMRDAILGPGGS